jgi:hypothetical protein
LFFKLLLRMKMRKRFSVLAAAAFALSMVAGGCAKEKSPPQPQPARKAIAETGQNAASKPHMNLFTGTIVALDEAAGSLTLKGPKGAMGFQAREKVKAQLDGLKIGDKVIVKHVDEVALSIVKPRTSKNVQRTEKEGAVKEVGPLPQAEEK